ncbi:hypothetical protein CsatA_009287 [Cannabis sativa]
MALSSASKADCAGEFRALTNQFTAILSTQIAATPASPLDQDASVKMTCRTSSPRRPKSGDRFSAAVGPDELSPKPPSIFLHKLFNYNTALGTKPNRNLISWSAKKQQVVARSSTESEFRALANTAAKIKWLHSVLHELQVHLPAAPIIWVDNQRAASLAANPVFHARSKHIEIDLHFVRDQILAKEIEVRYVPSIDQMADILTKTLFTDRFLYLKSKLKVCSTHFRLRGDDK